MEIVHLFYFVANFILSIEVSNFPKDKQAHHHYAEHGPSNKY
jgi:hypothetical protein